MTIADTRSQKLALGLSVTSTSTPALNAQYSVQAGDQLAIQAIVIYILVNNTFPMGAAQLAWPDAQGNPHLFTVVQFKAFATAVADYVAGVELQLQQANPIWPSPMATIP